MFILLLLFPWWNVSTHRGLDLLSESTLHYFGTYFRLDHHLPDLPPQISLKTHLSTKLSQFMQLKVILFLMNEASSYFLTSQHNYSGSGQNSSCTKLSMNVLLNRSVCFWIRVSLFSWTAGINVGWGIQVWRGIWTLLCAFWSCFLSSLTSAGHSEANQIRRCRLRSSTIPANVEIKQSEKQWRCFQWVSIFL